MKHVVVLSGGLDSTTLLYYVERNYPNSDILALSFDYGQRHKKELSFAARHAEVIGAEHKIVDISFLRDLFAPSGSSLVSDVEVPEGHYAEDNMKATVVPNRNMIMSSLAVGVAIAENADSVYLGVHSGDHFIYPDCRPSFFKALNSAVFYGNEGFGKVDETAEFVRTPFISDSKNYIAALAFNLSIPIQYTWSCYKGGDKHCGKCGTCVERREAIYSTGRKDPTEYEDNDFWLQALEAHK